MEQPSPQKSVIDWKGLQFNIKDVIAIIVFLFSASGIYYKVFYENAQKEVLFDLEVKQLEGSIKTNSIQIDLLKTQIRQLQDAEIRRQEHEALENAINKGK